MNGHEREALVAHLAAPNRYALPCGSIGNPRRAEDAGLENAWLSVPGLGSVSSCWGEWRRIL